MKNLIINIRKNYKLVLGTLIAGIIIGWIFFQPSGDTLVANQQMELHDGHDHAEEAPTTWTCSMHPQIKQNKPGQCPICAMDLIPLATMQTEGDNIDPNEIVMTKSAASLAEIQTMVVSSGVPNKTIYLQGKVEPDERNISELTARFGGRIEKLFVNFTGQKVKQGEKMATIYSPGLVTAQRELLESISFKDTRPSLYNAARGKLKLWDLNDKQIDNIEKNGEPLVYFDVLSPISGTVTMRHVSIGDYVKEGTPLFEVIDLNKLWVMFDAYEVDLPWIKTGDKIDFTVQALPGRNFSSKVSYIDPFINNKTRIAKVRLETTNKEGELKPEMFANGLLESKFAENSNEILIPKSSVLWTGKRAVVYVKVPDRENPSFLYRQITLGPQAGSFFVVVDGLVEGEEIAINGVFKIDAAAQLAGFPSMMNPDGGKISTGHNHGDSKMTDEEMENMEVKLESLEFTKVKTPAKFRLQLDEFIKNYLQLKDAFVATDEKQVEKIAKQALASFNKVDMTLLKGDAHNQWMLLQKPVFDNLNEIIEMADIEMKRSHFSIFSNGLTEIIQTFGNDSETPMYLQFCPMAFDDKGAYWISDKEEIRNPYFGDMMLKCGSVKKVFNE